ncbi:hypothetical protein Q5O89_10940 [Peribacillus frigoritolerans]|nr:hypothetical protein [Peribacillus frigoritolerans]
MMIGSLIRVVMRMALSAVFMANDYCSNSGKCKLIESMKVIVSK